MHLRRSHMTESEGSDLLAVLNKVCLLTSVCILVAMMGLMVFQQYDLAEELDAPTLTCAGLGIFFTIAKTVDRYIR